MAAQIAKNDAEINDAKAKIDAAEATGNTNRVDLYLAVLIELRKKGNLLLGLQQPGMTNAEIWERLEYPDLTPAVRDKLEQATVIFVERGMDKNGNHTKTGCGMGFFVKPRTVVTCEHNLQGFAIGDTVEAWIPKGDGKSGMDDLSLNLVKIDKDLDFAVLTTSKSYAHVQLFRGDPQILRGKGLVLCTYQIGLQQYLQEFDLQLTAMSAKLLSISRTRRHFTYECDSWSGDSGSAIVAYRGEVVGMHLEGVNAARETLEQKEAIDDRLTELQQSVKSLVKSTAQGGFGLLASAFPLAVSR